MANTLLNKYRRLENNNDHNEAALLLIKKFGTQEEVDRMERIKINHQRRGHILHEEVQERYQLSHKYYKLLINL